MPAYKNQHYVPQSVLNRFKNDSDELFYFFKGAPNKPVIHRNTEKIFSKSHLYSFEEKDGSRNTIVEAEFFKKLDTDVDPIITKIVSLVRENSLPRLTVGEKKTWNDFFIKQHARIPERFLSQDIKDSLDENYKDIKNNIYDRCIPELQDMLDDPAFKERLQAESRAMSLTTDLVKSNEILAQRGMFFARIHDSKKSFIIGSNPLVRCGNKGSDNLADPLTELWYPIAHDIAVSIGSFEEAETLHHLTKNINHSKFINRINRQIFVQSNEIAGRSKALIESIIHHFVKQSRSN